MNNRFSSLGMVQLNALIKGLEPQVAAAKRSARFKKECFRASELVPLLEELKAKFQQCCRQMATRDGIDPDAPAPVLEPLDLPDMDMSCITELLPKFD